MAFSFNFIISKNFYFQILQTQAGAGDFQHLEDTLSSLNLGSSTDNSTTGPGAEARMRVGERRHEEPNYEPSEGRLRAETGAIQKASSFVSEGRMRTDEESSKASTGLSISDARMRQNEASISTSLDLGYKNPNLRFEAPRMPKKIEDLKPKHSNPFGDDFDDVEDDGNDNLDESNPFFEASKTTDNTTGESSNPFGTPDSYDESLNPFGES